MVALHFECDGQTCVCTLASCRLVDNIIRKQIDEFVSSSAVYLTLLDGIWVRMVGIIHGNIWSCKLGVSNSVINIFLFRCLLAVYDFSPPLCRDF